MSNAWSPVVHREAFTSPRDAHGRDAAATDDDAVLSPSTYHLSVRPVRRRVLHLIHHLDLGQCETIADAGLSSVSKLRHLQRLDLGCCENVTDAGIMTLSALSQLQRLVTHMHGKRTKKSSTSCIFSLSQLRYLTFIEHPGSIPMSYDLVVAHIKSASLELLQHLDISWCKITVASLSSIFALSQLRHLNLSGCKGITDDGITNISVLSELQHLDLSYCRGITDVGVTNISVLSKLQHLDLCSCEGLTDVGLKSISTLTQMRHLNLSRCGITDEGFSSITALSQLEHLGLNQCDISDDGINEIAVLSQLQHLDLSYCADITDEGVCSLSHLSNLRHLNISSCCGIEGSCLGGFPTLTHLIATRCNLNDAGLGTISTRSHLQYLDVSFCDYVGCPLHEILTLTHLNLEHCGRVTDESLRNISELRELQHLQLRDCMSITDDGLWNLSALAQLQYLDLSYNKQITDAGIGSMSLDHLQHLNLFLCGISGDCFGAFPRVTSLDLGACRVTDSCLVSLLRLPHLQRVCLDHYNNVDLSIIAAQFQLKERAHTRGWWERL